MKCEKVMGTVNRHLRQEVTVAEYPTKPPSDMLNGSDVGKKNLLIYPFVPILLHDRCKISQPRHFLLQQSSRLDLTESVIKEASR